MPVTRLCLQRVCLRRVFTRDSLSERFHVPLRNSKLVVWGYENYYYYQLVGVSISGLGKNETVVFVTGSKALALVHTATCPSIPARACSLTLQQKNTGFIAKYHDMLYYRMVWYGVNAMGMGHGWHEVGGGGESGGAGTRK